MGAVICETAGMARRRKPGLDTRRPAPLPDLQLGLWLARLNKKPAKLAEAIGVTEGYVSLLISGERKNPGIDILFGISRFLGISINALYTRPPERDVTDRVHQLRPDQLEALGTLLDEIKKKPGAD